MVVEVEVVVVVIEVEVVEVVLEVEVVLVVVLDVVEVEVIDAIEVEVIDVDAFAEGASAAVPSSSVTMPITPMASRSAPIPIRSSAMRMRSMSPPDTSLADSATDRSRPDRPQRSHRLADRANMSLRWDAARRIREGPVGRSQPRRATPVHRARRGLGLAALAVLATAPLVANGAATATEAPAEAPQGDIPQPSLDEFLGSIVRGELITEAPVVEEVPAQTPREPFGGNSGASPAAQDAATMTHSFTVVVNPGIPRVLADGDRDGTPDLIGDPLLVSVPRNGAEVTVDFLDSDPDVDPGVGAIYNGGYLPPFDLPAPGGPPLTMNGLLNSHLRLDPTDRGIQNFAGQDVIVVAQPGAGDAPLNGPVILWGVRSASGFPLNDCGDLVLELILGADGASNWVPGDFAPLDLFTGTATDIAVRCDQGWSVERFANQGSGFASTSTQSAAIVTEGWMIGITPVSEVPDARNIRTVLFTTDRDNRNQPGGTAFTSHPVLPALAPAPPVILGNPFPGQAGPLPVNLGLEAPTPFPSGSPCGPQTWDDNFNVWFGEVGPDGIGPMNVVQVATGQWTTGTFMYDTDGNLLGETHAQVVTDSFSYNESFFFGPAGDNYIYQPGGVADDGCRWDIVPGTGPDRIRAGAPASVVLDPPDDGASEPVQPDPAPAVVDGSDGGDSGDSAVDDVDDLDDGTENQLPPPVGVVTDPGGGGFPFDILAGIGGFTLLAGGGLYASEKRKQGAGPPTPLALAEDDEDDDPLPGLDDPPETAAVVTTTPEPPPPREYEDWDLRLFSAEGAEWELNETDRARWKVLQDADATAAWSAAQAAEAQVQEQLRTMVATATSGLQSGIGAFSTAVETYGTAMNTLLSESDEIGTLYNEWTRKGGVKDIMWWVDLADAVVGLTRLVISLGSKAPKLVVRLLGSGDEAADAAKGGEAAVQGAADAADSVPDFLKPSEADVIYGGRAGNIGEVEEFVVGVLGRNFDDWAEALPAAATRLGYYMGFSDAAREVLLRLAAQARFAVRGSEVSFRADDLVKLERAAADPQFWRNLENAAAFDHGNRIYRMFDEQEVWWLWNLAGRPEAARAAGRSPTAHCGSPTSPCPIRPWAGSVSATPTTLDIGRVTPPASATGTFPDVLTLPHINPNAIDPNAATLGGGGILTLPAPPGTGVFDDVLTLPHGFHPFRQGWDTADTVIDGFRPLSRGWDTADTLLDTQRLGRPGGPGLTATGELLDTATDLIRPGQAAANPSGLGALSTPPPGATGAPTLLGAADAIVTGVDAGFGAGQGFSLLEKLGLTPGSN